MDMSTSLYTFLSLAFLASIVGAIVTAAIDAHDAPVHRPVEQH